MEHLTKTPFGRRVSAGLLAAQALGEGTTALPQFDKWQLFRTICTARVAIGVTDRDLTVLNALLTFYPGTSLEEGDNLIVFPSNAALAERAHGMAESTLRRHLAVLVHAGVIHRHDSPNGKRYAARGIDGQITRAFGFDLRPLLVRAVEFVEAAQAAEAASEALRRAREACVLLLRDVTQLTAYGREQGLPANYDELEDRATLSRRALRRKLTADDIAALEVELEDLLSQVHAIFGPEQSHEAEKMSGNDVQNERHDQNSNPDSYDLEPCLEQAGGNVLPEPETAGQGARAERRLPLAVVLKACPDVRDYIPGRIEHWHQLVAAADTLRAMMGVSPDAWAQAIRAMGRESAAIVLLCILQRMGQINSPGGYLRALSAKAEAGSFSPGPMVMALLNGANMVAA